MNLFLTYSSGVLLLALGSLDLVKSERIEYAPIVQLKAGKVVGLVQQVNGNKVYTYEGIRYGNASRFAKPTPVEPWTGVYDATHVREQCPQPRAPVGVDGILYQTNQTSENCLYLTIWKKADRNSSTSLEPKPVMVFIHGGTYVGGGIFVAGGGQHLAEAGDVIIVAIAYRLGALGLMSGAGIPPNLQLHDQIFALDWIQANIHSFGGNPKKVTIFGESSGSMNIGQLLLSPRAKGRYSQAILQSGAPNSYYGAINQTVADNKRQTFATLIGCPAGADSASVACLYEKSMEDFINATLQSLIHNEYFLPVYGNEVLPLSPREALKVGAFNTDVQSVLYGVNANEGTHFAAALAPEILSNSTKMTRELVRKEIVRTMKIYGVEYGEEVADFYLSNLKQNASQDELKQAIANPLGDFILTCSTILFGETLKMHAKNSTKFYSYRLAQHQVLPGTKYLPFEGVKHGEDVVYLFFSQFLTRPVDQQLSRDMIIAWTNFARTGSPGAIGGDNSSAIQWSEAVDQHHPYTRFMSLSRTEGFKMVTDDFYKKTCNGFWKAKLMQ